MFLTRLLVKTNEYIIIGVKRWVTVVKPLCNLILTSDLLASKLVHMLMMFHVQVTRATFVLICGF